MAKTISLPKTEYQRLRQIAERYELMRKLFEMESFAPPPVRDVREVLKSFRKTGLYREPFLRSLERGLRESSYFSAFRRK